jgi:hypothetical protein
MEFPGVLRAACSQDKGGMARLLGSMELARRGAVGTHLWGVARRIPAHGGEEGHPWLQNEAADFTSNAANYEPTADVAVWDMDRASWPVCCEEEGGAEFEYESPANPSSTEDNEEGGSAVYINGVAVMPACCRPYAHIGRMCGHCRTPTRTRTTADGDGPPIDKGRL